MAHAAGDPRIQYLLRRRFPEYFSLLRTLDTAKKEKRLAAAVVTPPNPREVTLLAAVSATNGASTTLPDQSAMMAALQMELVQMPDDDLQALYESERRGQQAEEEQQEHDRLQAEENARFFNQPNAVADFDYWSKAAYWTLDEGIALMLGKNPDAVTWENVAPLRDASPFAAEFARIRELAQRAKNVAQLHDRELPRIFLAWAGRYFKVIPELVEALEKQHVQDATVHQNLHAAKAGREGAELVRVDLEKPDTTLQLERGRAPSPVQREGNLVSTECETPEQRRTRLQKAFDAEKKAGNKSPNKTIAQREGISVSRVKQIRAKKGGANSKKTLGKDLARFSRQSSQAKPGR